MGIFFEVSFVIGLDFFFSICGVLFFSYSRLYSKFSGCFVKEENAMSKRCIRKLNEHIIKVYRSWVQLGSIVGKKKI